tara:strand:- start:20 stop:394 length:375 start_codon:yes stop_codon:yes gene_type:complete
MVQETKCINIDGNQVIDLTPDYNRPLALVDLTVLNQLTELLPKGNFTSIRHGLRGQIMNTNNLQELVKVAEDFVTFHNSVNLIREVSSRELNPKEQETTEPAIVGKIDLGDLNNNSYEEDKSYH